MRETKYILREALRACGDAEKIAKAADCLESFGIKVDGKQVKTRLEGMTHYETRIAEVARGLDDLDFFWLSDAETKGWQEDLIRIRAKAYSMLRKQD